MGSDGLKVDAVPSAAPGTHVTGTVEVERSIEVRSLAVRLTRVERSDRTEPSSYRAAEVTLAGPGPIPAGTRYPFTLALPSDAAPTLVTAHGSVRWVVQAAADVAGPDPVATTEVAVSGPRPRPSGAQIESIVSTVAATATADRGSNRLLGATFVVIGVAIAVLGAYYGANPPESWEEGSATGIVALAVGIGVFVALCGAVVLLAQRARPISDVHLTPDPVVLRPGDIVRIAYEHGGAGRRSIGLEQFELVQRVSYPNGGSGVISHQEHVLAAQWQPLPAGVGEVTFTVPADALDTYPGQRIVVGTRVAVVPTGKERSRRNRSHHRVQLVVRA